MSGVLWMAAGDGWGHAMRAASIVRHMRVGPIVVLTNAPRPLVGADLGYLPPSELPMALRILGRPDLVVGDQFQGQRVDGAEVALRRLSCPKVLLYRATDPGLPDATATLYDASVDVERGVLYRSADELPSWAEARALAGMPVDPDVRVMLRIGVPGGYDNLGAEWRVRQVSYDYFPVIELLPGVDLVLGHAGCNLAAECEATATPAFLWPKMNTSDQRTRARRWTAPTPPIGPRPPVPAYVNRAVGIADALDALVLTGTPIDAETWGL